MALEKQFGISYCKRTMYDQYIIEEFLRYCDQMDDGIKELVPLKKIWVVSNDEQ